MSEAPLPQENPETTGSPDTLHVVAAPDSERPEGDHVEVSPHEHEPHRPVADAPSAPKISILGDVELRVDVVLGRARRTLQDLLGIRPGQTIELDRQRNSPVEVLVNNKPFALGEIVVIDETNLGVRVLEILDWAAGTVQRSS